MLILIACVLVILQPRLNGWLAAHRSERSRHGGPPLFAGVLGSGVYGGYFGAAQGVLMIGLLGVFLDEPLQRINGLKNVLTCVVNGVAAIVFIALTHVAWLLAALIAVGSTVGGLIGAGTAADCHDGAARAGGHHRRDLRRPAPFLRQLSSRGRAVRCAAAPGPRRRR